MTMETLNPRRRPFEVKVNTSDFSQQVSRLELRALSQLPPQFILARPETPESPPESPPPPRSDPLPPLAPAPNGISAPYARRRQEDAELSEFVDPDYVLPERVREVLQSEGLARTVVDTALAHSEKRHRRAMYVDRSQIAKFRKQAKAKTDGKPTTVLPPISGSGNLSGGGLATVTSTTITSTTATTFSTTTTSVTVPSSMCIAIPSGAATTASSPIVTSARRPLGMPEPVRARGRGLEGSTPRDAPPGKGGSQPNPSPNPNRKQGKGKKGAVLKDLGPAPLLPNRTYSRRFSLRTAVREEIEGFQSEMEKMRWQMEQTQERNNIPAGFIQPRLVIISSRVSHCQSIQRAIHQDRRNILYFVYDFDKWSLDDLIKAIRDKLESYHPSAKALSIFFLCQGGPGYIYFLKNIVLTTQKLIKTSYTPVVKFWRDLGALMSKLEPDETAVHMMGCAVTASDQGLELMRNLENLMVPNIVHAESALEHTEDGKDIIDLYFDFRRYLLWRCNMDGCLDDQLVTDDDDVSDIKRWDFIQKLRRWTSAT